MDGKLRVYHGNSPRVENPERIFVGAKRLGTG